MTTWLDIVKKHAKMNKGKSLKDFLPDAKKEYDMLKKSGKIALSTISGKIKTISRSKTRKTRSKRAGSNGDDIAVDEIIMEEESEGLSGGRRKRSTRRTAKRSASRGRSRTSRRSRSRRGGAVYSPSEYNNTQEQNARQDDAVIMQQSQNGGKKNHRRYRRHRKH